MTIYPCVTSGRFLPLPTRPAPPDSLRVAVVAHRQFTREARAFRGKRRVRRRLAIRAARRTFSSTIGADLRLESVGARHDAGSELTEVVHSPAPDIVLIGDRAGVVRADVHLRVVDAEIRPRLDHLSELAGRCRGHPVAAEQVAPGIGEAVLRAVLDAEAAVIDFGRKTGRRRGCQCDEALVAR